MGRKGKVEEILKKKKKKRKHTFFFKSEMFSQMTTLMISPQHEKTLREVDFVRVQKEDTLHRKQPTINVITEEEVLDIFWISSNFEEFQEIIKLTVDVSTN